MSSHRIIMNPVRPGGGGIGVGGTRPTSHPKLPSTQLLKNVLGAWKFHSPNHEIQWKTKKPAGATIGSVVIQKVPKDKSGQQITAFVLKSDPKKVYYQLQNVWHPVAHRPGIIMNPPGPSWFTPKFFGPVSTVAIPK